MATIVKDNLKNRHYVLVGVGFGAASASVQRAMTPMVSSSSQEIAAVANARGEISWLPTTQLTVVSVDGHSCEQLLGER